MTPPTAPTQGAAQDLTDEKIEALRRHIVDEACVCDYEQDVLRLLAEVKRRRSLDVAATQARMEQHIEEERAAERRGWLAGREAAVFRLRAHPLAQAMVREIVPPAAEPLREQREPGEYEKLLAEAHDAKAKIHRVGEVLAAVGCDCESEDCPDPDGVPCEDLGHRPCLAHRIESALAPPAAPARQQPTPPDEPVNPGWCHERHPMWPKYIYCGRNMPCSDHPQEQLGRKEGAPARYCENDVCDASKTGGVLCAEDECDITNGVRPAPQPVLYGQAFLSQPRPVSLPAQPTAANPTAEPERKP